MQVHEAQVDETKMDLVAEGISANSTAFLEEAEEGKKPSGVGNPTEVALLLWLNRCLIVHFGIGILPRKVSIH
jgi:Ca2+-transporting ATPase